MIIRGVILYMGCVMNMPLGESIYLSTLHRLKTLILLFTKRAITSSLAHGLLTKPDLWRKTDQQLYSELLSSPEPSVRLAASKIRKDLIVTEISPSPSDDEKVLKPNQEIFRFTMKCRSLDPDVLYEGGIRRLSELDGEYGRRRGEWRERWTGVKGWLVEVPELGVI